MMLAETYTPKEDPLAVLGQPDRGAISVYARNRDYHDIVKKRLKRLARWLMAEAGGQVKVFVDTAPVPEKALGQAAGLGWQGKHTNLLARELGNWFFLGAIFTTLELPRCTGGGSLRVVPRLSRHLSDGCVSGALSARCAALHLLPDHRTQGPVDPALRPLMGNRIYGCDDCLAVCPWNKFAVAARRSAMPRGRIWRHRPLPSLRRWTTQLPREVLGQSDQADRTQPLCPERRYAIGNSRGRAGFDGGPRRGGRGGRALGSRATFVNRVNLC
jgi:epoxyqueuosine reductase QueG